MRWSAKLEELTGGEGNRLEEEIEMILLTKEEIIERKSEDLVDFIVKWSNNSGYHDMQGKQDKVERDEEYVRIAVEELKRRLAK
jgi:hypothetical protein